VIHANSNGKRVFINVPALSFLYEECDETEIPKKHIDERTYDLDFLLNKMKWSLGQVDQEMKKKNIEPLYKGGRLVYKFNAELGQTSASQKKQQIDSRGGIGRYMRQTKKQ
jgi:hypothetical protein